MSDYQHERGRLISIEKLDGEEVKDYFKRVLGESFTEEYWDGKDPRKILYEQDLYNSVFYSNGILYKVLELEEIDPYDDIQILREDPRGGYYFEMKYYNGGTCISEMIEESLEKLHNK